MGNTQSRMGDVVKLETPARKSSKTAAKSSQRRPARSRTALVLGGGGFTGEVYEIGALRALDLLASTAPLTSSTSTWAPAPARSWRPWRQA